MKSKILGLMTLSILALVLTTGMATAVLTLNPISSPTSVVAGDSVTFTFDLSTDIIDNTLNWSTSSSTIGTWTTLPILTSILVGQNPTLSATLSVPLTATGTITATIDLIGATGNDDIIFNINVIPAPTEVSACALIGDSTNLMELEIESITITGLSEEDEEWVPLDEIEVEVRVENTEKDFKLEDVEIGWGLYNLDTQEWILDEEESEFNLKDDTERDLIFTFKLEDPSDFEEGGNFVFYVWANAVGEESDLPVCRVVSEDIEIVVESDFLVLDNFQIEGIDLDEDNMYPDKLSCGSTLQLTADLWNIGDADQEDIEIRVYNFDFGIDEVLEIGDVDAFDKESISFEFTIPEGMEEGWNTLEFTIQEDGDIFENDYTDEDAEFEVLIDLENCALSQALVSASLDEGGKAGRELVVRSTITNTGTKSTTYLVNAVEYSEWASLTVIEPSTLILEAGQSADVLITLKVNRDISGEKLFNIEVVSEGELVVSQPLSVSVEKALIGDIFGDNGFLTALIIGIALILVIIIIVLAVRVARR